MKMLFPSPKISCFLYVLVFLGATNGAIAQNHTTSVPLTEGTSRQLIHDAAQAVDEAWEEFHRSAIGGTLASPTIQTQIEGQLHEARGLLMEARKADRRGDYRSVKIITDQLFDISHEIVLASREKKQ